MHARTRALVLTPNHTDGELAESFLKQSGINATAFSSALALATAVSDEIGCLVLVQEAITKAEVPILQAVLARQPAWADLPLIIVASEVGIFGETIAKLFTASGNVTLLERPLNPHTLVSSVKVCLRASARQREVGDLLAQRERAVRMRDEFLAMLAHELRNPLAPMRNSVYLMQRLGIDDPLFVQTRDILDRQLKHITRIVDDLMDVARLERGKVVLQTQRIDLNRAVAAAVETCLPVVQERGHHVQLQLSAQAIPVEADSVRIEQIVSNLVNNAAKFTKAAGEIRVATSLQGDAGNVVVSDEGIGFDTNDAENLFALFVQGTATLARSTGGLGIGLTIARRLAELHRGTLHATSPGVNKGSTFTLRLPLAQTLSSPPATTDASPALHSQSRSIVVIEDNPDIRETLHIMLTMWGHKVLLAGHGDAGLACVLRSRPDVALVDIGLPGIDGYEVARAIRNFDTQGRIRLIALTGYGQASDKEMAIQAGFDMHLLKPIAPTELARALASIA